MKKQTLHFTLVSLLFCFLVLLPTASSAQRAVEDILQYTNKYRKTKGKPPLKLMTDISEQARLHSKNMAGKKVGFGHSGFSKRTDKIRNSSGPFKAAAENVAYGQLTAREVVDLWIKSAGHRKNLLGNYNQIGIGTAKAADGSVYFTQIFINR